MSHPKLSPSPTLLANAAKHGKAWHTTQSAGYAYTFVSPIGREEQVIEAAPSRDLSWVPSVEDLGLTWTPRHRRHRAIDLMDPTEALDAEMGFSASTCSPRSSLSYAGIVAPIRV